MKSLLLFFACFSIVAQTHAQLFSKSFPLTGDKSVQCIMPVSDNGFVMFIREGDYSTKFWMTKTDHDLNVIWSKAMPLSGVSFFETPTILEMADGNYLLNVANRFYAFEKTSGTPLLGYSIPTFTSGGSYSYNNKCMQKPDGKILVLNTWYADMKVAQMSVDGVSDWSKTLFGDDDLSYGKCPGFDIEMCDDTTIVVSGKMGNDNCFAVLDENGNVKWTRVIDFDDTYSRPYGMCKMDDGNVLVVGVRSEKGFIMKMSPLNGDIIWQKEVNENVFMDVIPMGGDKYMLLGCNTVSSMSFGSNTSLCLFDGNGDLVKAVEFAGISEGGYRHPKFCVSGSKYYLFAYDSPITGLGNTHLIEFNNSLDAICSATPATMTKIAFTLPVINLGAVNVINTPIAPMSVFTGFLEDPLTVASSEFCIPNTPDVEIVPENPYGTLGNGTLNENGMSTGVRENNQQLSVKAYPNPAMQGQPITVSFDRVINGHISLTDLSGKTILQAPFSGNAYSFSTGNLAQGMYLLYCKSADGISQTVKINVE